MEVDFTAVNQGQSEKKASADKKKASADKKKTGGKAKII